MRIAATIVTCNRTALFSRALKSILNQTRRPDFLIVISNSTEENIFAECSICKEFDVNHIKNYRTGNYAGALNTAIEEIVKKSGISEDMYFASLDDDDFWLPEYLAEVEQNCGDAELVAAQYLRQSTSEEMMMILPEKISQSDFLTGNPGIGGSNTFISIKLLLKAGGFDEAFHSSVDRDFFVRVFQQNPTYSIVRKHLVTADTSLDRDRLTTNRLKKIDSLKLFYYKYQHIMSEVEKEMFFQRARTLFDIDSSDILTEFRALAKQRANEIKFSNKGNYQFIIGFIAGNEITSESIIHQIIDKRIPVDLVLIIEDIPKDKSLNICEELLTKHLIPYKIVKDSEWKSNLLSGYYGEYFNQFKEINSIPLGRTILHHHLYTETIEFDKPVFWIIDDDISFQSLLDSESKLKNIDIFTIINDSFERADAIIGGISNDPPVPLLSCIRSQLIDFYYSLTAIGTLQGDIFDIRVKPDYYYDLSDLHSNHLEVPLYHLFVDKNDFETILSGKALSRPALQKELTSTKETVKRRGANTLVLNRELLKYYPVINLQVNNKHARRGDLVWALFNQVVSNKKIHEHTFSVKHNRPISEFDLDKELNKSAYDIIGYAFAKSILSVIEKIKRETSPNRPKDIFDKLILENYFKYFVEQYEHFLIHRKTRFLINYYRIIGIIDLIAKKVDFVEQYQNLFADETKLDAFESTLFEAQEENTLKLFFNELTTAIWTFSKSITEISEDENNYIEMLKLYFGINKKLHKLGSGAEGIAFTDDVYVYKCFFNILESEWNFLKTISSNFGDCDILERIECHQQGGYRFIRYQFHLFNQVEVVDIPKLVSFLKFCKANQFVYTNFKPDNFIQTEIGNLKLVDYGKSFEPFDGDKFLNSIKRAFLLHRFPSLSNNEFQKLASKINKNEFPNEISGWEGLWRAVEPRRKEEILDSEVVKIIKSLNPSNVLDYGAGKCKTAKLIMTKTEAKVYVFDVDTKLMATRCMDFHKYNPEDNTFNNYFDVALLNLVLCEVEIKVVEVILKNIFIALKPEGHLVVSICNPDFAHVQKSEFQQRNSVPQNNKVEELLTKTCIYMAKQKLEYHRPVENYAELFKKAGYRIVSTMDTPGYNIETLESASDFKIFQLEIDK